MCCAFTKIVHFIKMAVFILIATASAADPFDCGFGLSQIVSQLIIGVFAEPGFKETYCSERFPLKNKSLELKWKVPGNRIQRDLL